MRTRSIGFALAALSLLPAACNDAASKIGGTWKAWMSSSTTDAIDRIDAWRAILNDRARRKQG